MKVEVNRATGFGRGRPPDCTTVGAGLRTALQGALRPVSRHEGQPGGLNPTSLVTAPSIKDGFETPLPCPWSGVNESVGTPVVFGARPPRNDGIPAVGAPVRGIRPRRAHGRMPCLLDPVAHTFIHTRRFSRAGRGLVGGVCCRVVISPHSFILRFPAAVLLAWIGWGSAGPLGAQQPTAPPVPPSETAPPAGEAVSPLRKLPVGEVVAELLAPVAPPNITAHFKKMDQALGKNRTWWAQYRAQNKGKNPLPYHSNMGISSQAYKEILHFKKNHWKLGVMGREPVAIVADRPGIFRIRVHRGGPGELERHGIRHHQ